MKLIRAKSREELEKNPKFAENLGKVTTGVGLTMLGTGAIGKYVNSAEHSTGKALLNSKRLILLGAGTSLAGAGLAIGGKRIRKKNEKEKNK